MTLVQVIELLTKFKEEYGDKVVYTSDIWFGDIKLAELRPRLLQSSSDVLVLEIINGSTPLGVFRVLPQESTPFA